MKRTWIRKFTKEDELKINETIKDELFRVKVCRMSSMAKNNY